MGEKPTIDRGQTTSVEQLVARIVDDAANWRKRDLPEGLSLEDRRAILRSLKDADNARAVALNAESLGPCFGREDIEWLFARGKANAAEQSIRFLPVGNTAPWVERLVQDGNDDLAVAVLNERSPLPRSVPGSVAHALGNRGKLGLLKERLGCFDELDEDIAVALIQSGHIRECLSQLALFPSLSQRTVDAMLAEDPRSLPVVANSIRKFEGLSEATRQRLVDAGFKRSVEEWPAAFALTADRRPE